MLKITKILDFSRFALFVYDLKFIILKFSVNKAALSKTANVDWKTQKKNDELITWKSLWKSPKKHRKDLSKSIKIEKAMEWEIKHAFFINSLIGETVSEKYFCLSNRTERRENHVNWRAIFFNCKNDSSLHIFL